MINGQGARGFLADSPGTPRTRGSGSRVDILSREYSRELTVSYRYRCDYLTATVPTARRNDRASSGREIAIRRYFVSVQ